MALDTVTVGSNQTLKVAAADPNSASNVGSVLSVANAKSLSGLYAPVVQAAGILQNPGGTYDVAVAFTVPTTPGFTTLPSSTIIWALAGRL